MVHKQRFLCIQIFVCDFNHSAVIINLFALRSQEPGVNSTLEQIRLCVLLLFGDTCSGECTIS